ncbi:MAG: hypothetical protein Q8L54_15065 [Devosia sp.]|nr:hypothetical protein [Devosia sp.]
MAMRKPGDAPGKVTSRAPVGRSASSGRFVEVTPAKAKSGMIGEKVSGGGAPLPQRGRGIITTTIKKAGGSLLMTVPAPARDALHLAEGQEMTVLVEGDRLIYEPARSARPKYSIDELIAKCDLSAPYPDEAREWIDAPAVGREIL